jgi:Tfp pilus assembly protein PilN
VVTEIDQSLELLSAKVNQMIASFGKVKNPAVEQQQQAIADVRYKMELLTATLDQLLSRLNQSEYLTTQEQGSSIGKGNRVHSLTTEGQNTPSSELMEVLQKIDLLFDKVDLISNVLLQRGLSASQRDE